MNRRTLLVTLQIQQLQHFSKLTREYITLQTTTRHVVQLIVVTTEARGACSAANTALKPDVLTTSSKRQSGPTAKLWWTGGGPTCHCRVNQQASSTRSNEVLTELLGHAATHDGCSSVTDSLAISYSADSLPDAWYRSNAGVLVPAVVYQQLQLQLSIRQSKQDALLLCWKNYFKLQRQH